MRAILKSLGGIEAAPQYRGPRVPTKVKKMLSKVLEHGEPLGHLQTAYAVAATLFLSTILPLIIMIALRG